MKQCNTCGHMLGADSFHARKASPDGLAYKCKACVKAYDASHRSANVDRLREYDQARYKNNADRKREYQRLHYEQNKERLREYDRARKPIRYQKAKHLYNEYAAARCKRQRHATPSWINREVVKDIYLLAQEFREAGFDVHVDHMIPLKGKAVCGLHVHNNLRVCLAKNNLEKWNKYE